MWFSIFMASRMQTTSPGRDLLALLDEDLQDRALHRGEDLAVDVPAVREPRGLSGAFGRDIAPFVEDADGHAAAVDLDEDVGGPALVRRRRGGLKFDLGGKVASASARSSHVVVWVAERNSFESRIQRCTGIVVGTPFDDELVEGPQHPAPRRLAVRRRTRSACANIES